MHILYKIPKLSTVYQLWPPEHASTLKDICTFFFKKHFTLYCTAVRNFIFIIIEGNHTLQSYFGFVQCMNEFFSITATRRIHFQ